MNERRVRHLREYLNSQLELNKELQWLNKLPRENEVEKKLFVEAVQEIGHRYMFSIEDMTAINTIYKFQKMERPLDKAKRRLELLIGLENEKEEDLNSLLGDMREYVNLSMAEMGNKNPVEFYISQLNIRVLEECIKEKYKLNNDEFFHNVVTTIRYGGATSECMSIDSIFRRDYNPKSKETLKVEKFY